MKNTELTLYHGSPKIVGKPVFGLGKANNDYGQGFYCTEDIELAKEWACPREENGYANKYRLDTRGLRSLDLESSRYSILHWITILIENRKFDIDNDIAQESVDFLTANFHIDTSGYDIIKGWRADDAYFSFANLFINSNISIQRLRSAMVLGNLGTQIVLKSKTAFDRIEFIGADVADASIYYPLRTERDSSAKSFQGKHQNLQKNP